MDSYEALARSHMLQQVREATTVQVALSRLWDRTIDKNDLEGSFEKFERAALPLIRLGRSRGELTAQQYYEAVTTLAGLDDPITVDRQPLETEANRRALYSTGYGHAKRRLKEGMTADAALSSAKASMLRASKRRMLNAGRQRLVDLSAKDPNIRGWARVSDGSPCYFCALLVSRGPVYTASTGAFKAHDGCGCSVRPIARNDPSRGWSEDARAIRALYDEVGEDGYAGSYDWRKTWNAQRATTAAA